MAELVECARLEIVYTGDRIEGSNPPISAIRFRLRYSEIGFVENKRDVALEKRMSRCSEYNERKRTNICFMCIFYKVLIIQNIFMLVILMI